MKAIIVARVSTDEQKENSPEAQLFRMEHYCENRNFNLAEKFNFVESAYKTKRDEFESVVECIKGYIERKERVAVCFDKVDRLSRNIFDKRVAWLYERAVNDEIELHFVSDGQVINNAMNAGDKFAFGMKLGLSKYYSDAISDNVKRTFELKRRKGEWTGKVRIGYKNVPLDIEKRLRKDIIIDPERGPLVQKLFELYATGNYSIRTVWKKITEMGLKSRDDNKLSPSNIELILKDPFYYGQPYSKKYGLYQTYHPYPKLITKDLFDKCQDVRLGRSKKRSKLDSMVQYIFKGLLTCKHCGCLMSPEVHKKKSGLTFIYYSCTNAKGICKREYVPEKTLLERVYSVFSDFERIPRDVQEQLVDELRGLNESEKDYHNKQLSRIRTEYDRVQKRISALLDMRLDQSITSADYDKKLQELKDQQRRLDIEAEEHTEADNQYHIHVNTVFNLARHMKEIFESSEPMEKRAFLNFLLQNPTVEGKKLDFTLRKPFNYIHELALCPTRLRDQGSNLGHPR
jgi:DNA invertase Pin-like site-specific DNA recombinase